MKTKIIKVLLVCSLVLLLCPLAFATDELSVILQKPVKVTARDIDGSEPDHYQLEIGIEYGGDRFEFHTNMFQTSSFKEAIENQKTSAHWKGHYLLIGRERGGGNASRGYLRENKGDYRMSPISPYFSYFSNCRSKRICQNFSTNEKSLV